MDARLNALPDEGMSLSGFSAEPWTTLNASLDGRPDAGIMGYLRSAAAQDGLSSSREGSSLQSSTMEVSGAETESLAVSSGWALLALVRGYSRLASDMSAQGTSCIPNRFVGLNLLEP